MKLLKSKALFQIIILICATIYISIALAEPVKAATKVCCEKTSASSPYSGESCIFTDQQNCDSAYRQTPIACQQTDYCGPGCCIKEGECKKNTPKSICIAEGGIWKSGPECDIPQCQKGCCSLPTECAFVTQAKCALKIKDFEALQLEEVFDPSITTELDCLQKCRGAEMGCCLTDPCKFTQRGNCPAGTEFELNKLCSYVPGCDCTEKHHTNCLADRDGVYWFDSCGNIENIYGTTYRSDGFVVPKENSCTLNEEAVENDGDVYCGNCDYSKGSVCREADDNFLYAVSRSDLPTNIKDKVKHMCADLSCDSPETWGSKYIELQFPPWTDTEKLDNGQSFCEYEGAVGEGKDLVGSRHYRYVCINGRIIKEECKEKRKEICIQGDIPPELFPDGTTGAICRPNLYTGCLACNEEDGSCGLSAEEIDRIDCGGECNIFCEEGSDGICQRNEIREDKDGNSLEPQLKECCNKQKCREKCCSSSLIDCYWHEGTRLCAPAVPPGGLGEEANCLAEAWTCTELWAKGGFLASWTCVENCDCYKFKDGFGESAATYCRSLGDCGAHYNVVGKYSKEGFTFKGPAEHIYDYVFLRGEVHQKTKDAEPFEEEEWSNFNIINKPTNGTLFFIIYATELIFSIISPENIARKTDIWKDWSSTLYWGVGLTLLAGFLTPSVHLSNAWNLIKTTAFKWEFAASVTAAQVAEATATAAKAAEAVATAEAALATAKAAEAVTEIAAAEAQLASAQASAKAAQIAASTATEAAKSATLGVKIFEVIGTIAIYIAIIVLILWILSLGAESKEVVYSVSCEPWVPPDSGEDCEKCNDFTVCDKYKCQSLGRACELRNEGFPGDEICTWVNRNDMTSPIITPLPIAPKTMQDLILTPEGSGVRGYAFRETIPVYTPLDIGITTNKYAQCKISKFKALKFDEMTNFFGKGIDALNHTMTIPIVYEALPDDQDTIAIDHSGLNTFYVKCKNVNGIANDIDYFIKFNVADAPDLIPPIIEEYSIPNNAHIPAGVNEIELIIYLNEPASPKISGCKYSTLIDQPYQNMPYNFTCSESAMRENLYSCSTTLNGLQDKKDNVFYFKCRDKAGNTNDDDQPPDGYHLFGTTHLNITSTEPSGTIYITDINLTITTANGAENGKSICSYSTLNYFDPNGLQFSQTDATKHSQSLTLASGSYKFFVWCYDVAGNEAKTTIEFTITAPKKPAIEQIYKTDSTLHITLTQESKDCQYALNSFTYGEGTPMTKIDSKNFELPIQNPTYYIACESIYGIKSDPIKVYT